MFRAAQRWFYYIQDIEILTSDKDPPLQPVRTTQIALARYGLGDTYKGFLEVDYPCPKREVLAWNTDREGYTLYMGFGVRNIRVNIVTTRN